jgi:hypothetical protein
MKQQIFAADHVWALAVIADRINGGYSKEGEGHFDDQINQFVQTKKPNKLMVKEWLREGTMTPTEADIAEGQRVRNHFKGLLLKQMAGKINDFESQALKIAQKDEFSGRDLLDFAIISCLPASARRDQERKDLNREVFSSTQLVGNIGEKIVGDAEVISSRYSPMYDKFRINARMGESFVDFWFSKEFDKGATVRVEGKIKALRGDKTTQLNYVKIRG